MAKFHRTTRPPAGAGMKVRNTRLYGGYEEQVSGEALRSKGQPDPRYGVITKPRADLRREREQATHKARLQAAKVRMLSAQDAVRHAKKFGFPYGDLAQEARAARAAYLALSGGTDRKTVDVSLGSETSKVRAV